MEFLRNLLSGPTIGIIIAIIAIAVILTTGYLKAPPDTAIIISGIGKKPRILVGRAGLRIPFFERIDRLTLKQISIDIRTEDYISTKDYINITVDAVAGGAQFSADAENTHLARSQQVTFRTLRGNVQVVRTIRQAGQRLVLRDRAGSTLRDSSSKTLTALKDG